MLARSLGFLRHAWSADERGMRNFMSYDRRWLDQPHAGDHLGRAAWALGRGRGGRAGPGAARAQPDPAARDAAGARRAALAAHDGLRRPRPRPRRPRGRSAARRPASCARSPAGSPTCSARTRRRTGTGPRTCSTYDNARLPQALIAAGARLGDEDAPGRRDALARLVRGRAGHRRPMPAARRASRPPAWRAASGRR